MPADYDLVVLGGTLEGRQAALVAAGYGARVALVEPPGLFLARQQAKYLLKGLMQLAAGQAQHRVWQWFLANGEIAETKPDAAALDWAALVEWSAIAAETQQPEYSLPVLGASGVDVICAMPERLSGKRFKKLVVTATERTLQKRSLQTRAVLAAFGTVPLPVAEALPKAGATVTGLESLLHKQTLPRKIFVWGGGFGAIAWAEALSAVGAQTTGVQITLVADTLLPGEDAEVRQWVRSHLSAAGIQLADTAKVLNAAQSTTERLALAARSLFLGTTWPAFTLPAFVYASAPRRLDASNQQPTGNPIPHNKYLQTAHPQIFACGSLIEGRATNEATAQREVQTAVWNALFVKNRKIDYSFIPQGHGRVARVGVVPQFAQAGRTPAKGYAVWSASSSHSADLRRVSPLPSYCKLICRGDRLQSISLFGDGASELIESLAASIGRPISVLLTNSEKGLCTQHSADTLSELVKIAASQSIRNRWQPGQWRRDCAENWFNWRRSRR